jgi:HlyD family secretion protein
MIKNYCAGAAVLAVSSIVLSGCSAALAAPIPADEGTVEFDEWVLGFEVAGRVATLVDRGQVVPEGAEIASLDPSLEKTIRDARDSDARAARAELALLKAGSRAEDVRSMADQVRASRASEDLLQRNLDREKTLLSRGASTQAAVDDLDGRLQSQTAERQSLEQKLAGLRRGSRTEEIDQAEARAASADAALRLEDERLARHQLHAPGAGVVLDVQVKAGEVVAAGAPVLTVGDTAHPYADVFVPEGKLTGIKAGLSASVRVDGEASAFPAKVERVWQKTEFTPRYLFSDRERPNLVVRVRVRINDPGQKLHAGVPAFVTFDGGRG